MAARAQARARRRVGAHPAGELETRLLYRRGEGGAAQRATGGANVTPAAFAWVRGPAVRGCCRRIGVGSPTMAQDARDAARARWGVGSTKSKRPRAAKLQACRGVCKAAEITAVLRKVRRSSARP